MACAFTFGHIMARGMAGRSRKAKRPRTAFVLGGGGHMGAHEVGMLRALLERDVRPDLVVGTSVGALNGAAVAARPDLSTVDRLEEVWNNLGQDAVFDRSPFAGAANLLRSRTHLYSNRPLRRLVEELPARTFEELEVPFQCVAACIERAAEHWFSEGPLVDAILASAAVPGLLPMVEIGGEHFIDGGVVNSIPIERAVELGATEIFVLHVGRIERPLEPPRNLWQVAVISFEVARRHRFAHDLAHLPDGVIAHVLPTGDADVPRHESLAALRYRDLSAVAHRIDQAHRATAAYLEEKGLPS
jgi:NTE family protein